MAEASGPNLTIMVLLSSTSLAFLIHHTVRFDGCRCLLPNKKNWFRCLMTWMLVVSNLCLIVWAGGWCYIKTQLGWVRLGPSGARPWPSPLFPPLYARADTPLAIILAICYSCQASLNAEEALFMIHLMRAVRCPKSAIPFLKSRFFIAWLFATAIITSVQLGVIWITPSKDLQIQISRMLLITGVLEILVLTPATIIIYRFPAFLTDIKTAGAGPEVRIRLYHYHSANKARTFFRFFFTAPLFIIGIDGTTKLAKINNTPMAVDLLATISVGALCIAMMISITLYLPRTQPSAVQNVVMVGQQATVGIGSVGRRALARMSIFQEGGQWSQTLELGTVGIGVDAPFAQAQARGGGLLVDGDGEGVWQGQIHSRSSLPKPLANFVSPIDVNTEVEPNRPVEIRMVVERDIHKD